jgi:glycosyltransferase involved in cell wall biosynthesis
MPDPIRLALVITELEPGGAERCLVNLATRLDRERFQPVVYSLGPRPRADRELLVEQLLAADVPVQFLGLTHWSQYFRAVRRLATRLAEQQAQVVQSFLFHANVVAARSSVRAGGPRFFTGIRVADPRRTRTSLERWATNRAERHICVSQSVADFCHQRSFAAQKLAVIRNGIDIAKWKTAQPADLTRFGVTAGRRAVVYVGRLDRQKGLGEFLGALKPLFAALPAHDLLLVGDGPEADRLKSLAVTLQIADRVHFAGWQADIPAIVAASDLLTLPSRWEGLPNAVLEAMAAGKPVAATRCEGVEELLGPAADGQSVPLSEFDRLPAMIAELLSKPERAAQLGRQNQQRAEEEFSLSAMVERYSTLYEC